jgi:hypothetical protein
MLSRKPDFPYPVSLPTPQSPPHSKWKTFDNRDQSTESQPAQNHEQVAQHMQQSNEDKTMDEGDARLLHLLQVSIQDN